MSGFFNIYAGKAGLDSVAFACAPDVWTVNIIFKGNSTITRCISIHSIIVTPLYINVDSLMYLNKYNDYLLSQIMLKGQAS